MDLPNLIKSRVFNLSLLVVFYGNWFYIIISQSEPPLLPPGIAALIILGIYLYFVWCRIYICRVIPATLGQLGYWFGALCFTGLSAAIIADNGVTGILITFIVALFLHRRLTQPRDEDDMVLSGRKLRRYEAVKKAYDAMRSEEDPGVLWGGVFIPSREATTHFLAIGASGSGKTITLRFLMQYLLPRINTKRNCRALIYDAKRDTLSTLRGMNEYCPIVLLNPFDRRCAAWDMARDINTYAEAESLANILVPKEGEKDPFWRDSTVQLLRGVTEFFILNAPGQWTLRDIVLTMRSQQTLRALLGSDPETAHYLEALENEKTAANIMSTVATKMGRYRTVAALWHKAERKVSLVEWAASSSILVLGKDNQAEFALNALNQLIFTRAAQILLDKPETKDPETFIIFDELPSAGKLDKLMQLCTEGRSKGVCIAAGFQSFKNLADVYNENAAHTITGQFRHKAILRLDDEQTAEWASKLIGDQERIRIAHGVSETPKGLFHSEKSYSQSQQFQTRRAVMPSELLSIPPIDASLGQGLKGYYITREVYPFTYGIKFIDNCLLPKSSKVRDFIPQPAQYQRLEPWTEEDIERLGIGIALKRQGSLPMAPPLPEMPSIPYIPESLFEEFESD